MGEWDWDSGGAAVLGEAGRFRVPMPMQLTGPDNLSVLNTALQAPSGASYCPSSLWWWIPPLWGGAGEG